MDIQLTFINHSNDANNSEVVIFQKNISSSFEDNALAWKVIKNCGRGDYHPFSYSQGFSVAAADSWGNHTPRIPAKPGEVFSMIKDASGDVLAKSGIPAADPHEIEIRNELSQGSIDAIVYKSGNILAKKDNLSPDQKALFNFKPSIFIGVVSHMEEGDSIDSSVQSSFDTEISLLGIASADIVMRGGGSGSTSKAFTFSLENIRYA